MKKPIQVFGFQICNVTDESVDIHIDGEIVDGSTQEILQKWFGDTTSTSYKSFRNELNKHKVKTYNVYINSPGGHVGDALAIHDLLTDLQQKSGKTVNTIGRGIIASAATLILLSSEEPEMSENSWFMMHDVSGGAWGSVTEVENQATTMRKFNDKVRDVYAKKSGSRKEDVAKWMKAETWFTAEEAKEKGLVSKISGEATFTNKISNEVWDMYEYTNKNVLVAYNDFVKPPDSITQQITDMKKFMENLASTIMSAIKGVKPTEETTQEQLVGMIADAVSNTFKDLAPTFETSVLDVVKNQVTEQLKNFKPEIPAPVVDIKNIKIGEQTLEEKLAEIDDSIEQMDDDIANKIGNPIRDTRQIKKVVPIGGFS
jgi:ATP-dependent Clp endopeptidase proteolytic subunit ClpP